LINSIDNREGKYTHIQKENKMEKEKSLDEVKKAFLEIADVIDGKFGEKYASKNPGLVQCLLGTVQQLEDRKARK